MNFNHKTSIYLYFHHLIHKPNTLQSVKILSKILHLIKIQLFYFFFTLKPPYFNITFVLKPTKFSPSGENTILFAWIPEFTRFLIIYPPLTFQIPIFALPDEDKNTLHKTQKLPNLITIWMQIYILKSILILLYRYEVISTWYIPHIYTEYLEKLLNNNKKRNHFICILYIQSFIASIYRYFYYKQQTNSFRPEKMQKKVLNQCEF